MTTETLDYLHTTYNQVAEDSETFNILDMIQGIYDRCLEFEPPAKDSNDFDVFIRNLDSAIRIRKKTFQLTNMVSDIVFLMMYIIIWINDTHHLDLDFNIIARRKSLESELTKLLKKDNIRDRFGIRCIVLNKSEEKKCIEKLYIFYKFLIGIMTRTNRLYYNDFLCWIKGNSRIDTYTRERLLYILNIPFKEDYIKDYIKHPKPNGYKSLQFTIAIEMYSDILPGTDFEIQLRTQKMDQIAEHGEASHDKYKKDDAIAQVFQIDDFSKVELVGLSSYTSVADDIDGIHFAKTVINRRISNSLIF